MMQRGFLGRMLRQEIPDPGHGHGGGFVAGHEYRGHLVAYLSGIQADAVVRILSRNEAGQKILGSFIPDLLALAYQTVNRRVHASKVSTDGVLFTLDAPRTYHGKNVEQTEYQSCLC